MCKKKQFAGVVIREFVTESGLDHSLGDGILFANSNVEVDFLGGLVESYSFDL